jgi:hypothetical protein
VTEVAGLRHLEVDWRFISLRMVNHERHYDAEFPPGYLEGHTLGLQLLRVAAAAREEAGNAGVARPYEVLGGRVHVEGHRDELRSASGVGTALADAGLPSGHATAANDERYYKVVRAETDLALTGAGAEVGSPIVTFAPPDGPSFFGQVISRVPRGEEAIALWDASERLARFPGFAELKRSLRESPQFA